MHITDNWKKILIIEENENAFVCFRNSQIILPLVKLIKAIQTLPIPWFNRVEKPLSRMQGSFLYLKVE